MLPTLATTLDVKGQRPHVPTRDSKDRAYVIGSVDVVTGALTHRVLEVRARTKRRTRQSKTASLHQAFARHLRSTDMRLGVPTPKGSHIERYQIENRGEPSVSGMTDHRAESRWVQRDPRAGTSHVARGR